MPRFIVDDNSPDGTGRLADALCKSHPTAVFVIHRPLKQGLGSAYLEAFRRLIKLDYDVVIQMDADYSHRPEYIRTFLDQLAGSDLVLGSRYLRGINVVNWDFKRLLLSKLANKWITLMTGMPYSDSTSGFKAWRKSALQAIELSSPFANGYLFQIETTNQAYRRRLRISEVSIIFYERNCGASKVDLKIIAEALLGVIRIGIQSIINPR